MSANTVHVKNISSQTSEKEIRDLFTGTEIIQPGIVPRPLWRPDGEVREDGEEIWGLVGVGIKR